MTTLNRQAAELMVETPGVHACTDITGFGFLGHACEMIDGSETGLRIFSSAVPAFDGIKAVIDEGYLPGGLYRNKNFRMAMIEVKKAVPEWRLDLLFDPQTSGGLLISLEAKEAEGLVKRMRDSGVTDAAVVGEVTKEPKAKIIVE
jgi:selenide,water dikinase